MRLFLYILALFLFSCMHAQEGAMALNPDEEITKYEVRGVVDSETPSVSIYYEGKQLGWMKTGQKKGNCLLKAYDKNTKEIVLEIDGKEYRLREGIRQPFEFDGKNFTARMIVVDNKRIVEVRLKNKDHLFDVNDMKHLEEIIPSFNETDGVYIYGGGMKIDVELENTSGTISSAGPQIIRSEAIKIVDGTMTLEGPITIEYSAKTVETKSQEVSISIPSPFDP